MSIKAIQKHFRKACWAVVLCFALHSACIMGSDTGACRIYYLVNWKDWGGNRLAEFFPLAIPCLSRRLCPWFEAFMLASTKEQARLYQVPECSTL